MGDPTLLNLDTIAAGQQGMYQTSNDADAEIEKATNDWLAVALTADVVLTGPQFTRAYTFVVSGTVTHNLTVPATKRIFAVENNNSSSINVVCGSTSIPVASGDVAVFKTDGTANGLKALVGSSGASGTAGGDLTGTYPNPTIGAGKVSLAKMANLAADSIIGNNTGSPATPLALTAAQVKTLLALAVADVTGAAPLASPPLTGTPTAPTAAGGTNTTQLATTAFVEGELAGITGGMVFKGVWNANTNSPTITSGVGTLGWFYKVGTAGATTVDGNSSWNVGDMLLFDGSTWDKIDGISTEVITVAGRTGAVVLASGDVSGLATSATTDTTNASNIGSGSLALARLAAIATLTILGNNTGGSAVPSALTAAQVKTLLAIASGDVSGLATSATTDTTNASNISSGTLAAARLAAIRYDIATFYPGIPGASQLVLRWQAPRAVTIPSGATNSQASSNSAATGSTTFTIKQNGSSVGTIVWTGAGTTGAFTVGSTVNIAAGDIITITGPVSPDATIADIAITLAATA